MILLVLSLFSIISIQALPSGTMMLLNSSSPTSNQLFTATPTQLSMRTPFVDPSINPTVSLKASQPIFISSLSTPTFALTMTPIQNAPQVSDSFRPTDSPTYTTYSSSMTPIQTFSATPTKLSIVTPFVQPTISSSVSSSSISYISTGPPLTPILNTSILTPTNTTSSPIQPTTTTSQLPDFAVILISITCSMAFTLFVVFIAIHLVKPKTPFTTNSTKNKKGRQNRKQLIQSYSPINGIYV